MAEADFAEYLYDLVEHGFDEVAIPDTVDIDIDRFRDVIVADATVLRLHRLLSDEFEPRQGEQSGARLYLLHNVTDQTIARFNLADKKHTTAPNFLRDRGWKIDWCCSIKRTSSTAALR